MSLDGTREHVHLCQHIKRRILCPGTVLKDLQRAVLGIEPRTSRTLSENHTTRPNSQVFDVVPCKSPAYAVPAVGGQLHERRLIH